MFREKGLSIFICFYSFKISACCSLIRFPLSNTNRNENAIPKKNLRNFQTLRSLIFLCSCLISLNLDIRLPPVAFCFLPSQLNGWRLFDVTSHCLASRLSRGATINTLSIDFFGQSLLIPLTRAANTLNIHRKQANTELSVNDTRRSLFCRVINHLHENTWNSEGCFPPYEPSHTSGHCDKCPTSKPR